MFFKKSGGQLKLEAKIILALNKVLQKAKVKSKVRFSQVGYALSGFVLALRIEKTNVTMFFSQ